MKLIVLDYSDNSVNVLPLTKEAVDAVNMDDFNDWGFLQEQGFYPPECNWMLSEEDDIPVYYKHESIPFTSI